MSAQPNPQYRVEHVAETPRGWKVRTKMMATHMVRMAFPPGARRKGSGKVIEIFHPVNENPCAMRNTDVTTRQTRQRSTRERAVRIRGARLSNPVYVGHSKSGYVYEYKRSFGKTYYSFDGGRNFFPSKSEAYKSAQSAGTLQKTGTIRQTVSNPSSTESAAALYETFHGKTPKEILEMQESDAARHTYTALGDLSELVLDAPAGKVKIGFDSTDAVKVASAPGGKQLYLLGGNQNLDSQLGRFGSDPGKDFVELGAATQITYQARKSIDDFKLVDYFHNLGEETNEPPYAFYDRLKRRIFLAGGRYRVEAPGIIN